MNVGIIGAGNIANRMAKTLNAMQDEGFCAYAVASRSMEKAMDFAKTYGIKKAYDNYEDLMRDEAVDIVYIATPHALHLAQMKMALRYGKSVLCEKILTTSSRDSEAICRAFDEAGVFLAEALWTSYMPWRSLLNRLLFEDKIIGTVTHVDCEFDAEIMAKERIASKALGGGSAMDLGVYPLSFVMRTLGFDGFQVILTERTAVGEVDGEDTFAFTYGNGVTARARCSALTKRNTVEILGTMGKITLNSTNNPTEIVATSSDGTPLGRWNVAPEYTGFEYQLRECRRCIAEGLTESPLWSHSNTVAVAHVVDLAIQD